MSIARHDQRCQADPLHLLFRVVVMCGARRTEAAGFRRSGAGLHAGYLTVDWPILQLGGEADGGEGQEQGWRAEDPAGR